MLGLAIWSGLPSRRLKYIAGAGLENISKVRVTGVSGFLAGDWVVACQTDEVSFLGYCLKQDMKLEETIDIQDRLKRRSLIRSAKLVASLPDFDDPLQFSRLEGGRQEYGLLTMFDRRSGTMVIYRYYHD